MYLVDALDAYIGELGLQVVCKHSCIELGHNHATVAAQHLGGIGGQRVDVAEVRQVHGSTLFGKFLGSCAQVSVSAAPAYKQGIGLAVAVNLDFGDILSDIGDDAASPFSRG